MTVSDVSEHLRRAATLAVHDCAEVSDGDKCLIVCDQSRWPEGEALREAILQSGGLPLMVDVTPQVARYYATRQRPEPPDHMAAAFSASTYVFSAADVEYCHLLGHTERNQAAQASGMQYVLIEEDMATWATTREDVDLIADRTQRVTDLVRRGKWVSITSPKGTDVQFQLKPGRKVWNFAVKTAERREALIIPNYGESACVPWEGTTEGRAIIDGYLIGIGPVSEPVELVIRGGRAVEVNGGKSAQRLRELMAAADENANNIAECGICTSHREKRAYEYPGEPGHFSYGAWGTTHLAVGHSHTIGGDVHSSIHLDCQMYDTTVHVDDVCVMERGEYRI